MSIIFTKTIPLDDLAYEAVRERLRKQLGTRPESIPCDRNPAHKPRQVDAWMLSRGEIRYVACAECASTPNWERAGIPPRLIDATVAGYRKETEEQKKMVASVVSWIEAHIRNEAARKTFLVLAGHPGTGKSHLSAASLKAIGGGWMTTPLEIFRLKGARMNDHREPCPVEKAKKAKCLVLDEWVVGGDRADAPETWAEILDHRYQRQMPTVMASNAGAKTIAQLIGLPGIHDRIRSDSVVCSFTWSSYRS